MGILSRFFTPAKHRPGVYSITNRVTGCVYIGATTLAITARWQRHRDQLTAARHHNSRLQADWDKYGPHVFRFAVIEVVEDTDRVFDRERYWQERGYTTEGRYNPPVGQMPQGKKSTAAPSASVEVARNLRSQGYTRDQARVFLREQGYSLGNDTWAAAKSKKHNPEAPELEYKECKE
jgi:hypothetical protein